MAWFPGHEPATAGPVVHQVNELPTGGTLHFMEDALLQETGQRVDTQGGQISQKGQGEDQPGREKPGPADFQILLDRAVEQDDRGRTEVRRQVQVAARPRVEYGK